MARIPALSDGQPLTYELINKIIEKLGSIKEPAEDQSPNILFFGPNLKQTSKDTTIVICGSHSFNMPANAPSNPVTVKFKSGKKFIKPPIVTANIVDPVKGGSPDMATLVITEQKVDEFVVKVSVLKSNKKAIPLQINYIAVGPG